MRRRFNGINIVGTLLVICVALVVIYALRNVNGPFRDRSHWGWSAFGDEDSSWSSQEDGEELFSSDIGEIHIDTISGRIEVFSWDSSDIKVEYQIVSSNNRNRQPIEVQLMQQGNRIVARRKSDSIGNMVRSGSVHFQVYLPDDVELDGLNLNTVSGRIEVAPMEGIRRIEADTVSGSISVQAGERVKLSTISGRINGNFTGIEEFRGDSTSGRIEVYVEDPQSDFNFRGDSVSGSINLYCEDFEGDVSMDSVSGSMKTEQDLILEHSDRTSLRGRIGDGDMSFNADSVSGSILLGLN